MSTPPDSDKQPGEISFVTGLDGHGDFVEEDEEAFEENAEDSGASTVMIAVGAALLGVVGSVVLAIAFLAGSAALEELEAQGKVIIVTRDLRPGESLSEEDLALIPGALPNTWHNFDKVVGATLKMPLYAGDPVRLERLSVAVEGEEIAMSAPEDNVWLREGKGISGLGLEIGDRVDIWSAGGKNRESIVAEDVPVIDIGRGMEGTARRITFAIPGDPGRSVELARESGLLYLALRATSEDAVDTSQWTIDVPPPPPEATGEPHLPLVNPVGPGHLIVAEDLAARPGNEFTVGAFTVAEDAVGRVAREILLPGEVLTESKLAHASSGRGLSTLVKSNQRGIALSLGGSAADAVPPGTMLTIQNVENGKTDEVLAENVEVVGISPRGIGCPCIVLGVDEPDVGLILHSQAVGTLAVSLPEEEAPE